MAAAAYTNVFKEVILPILSSEDELKAIEFLQEYSLLKREMDCYYCALPMNCTRYASNADGYMWRCQNRNCEKYQCKRSVRTDSMFVKSRLKLSTWIHLIYKWSTQQCQNEVAKEVGVSLPTVGAVFGFLRHACERHFLENPIKLGGPGVIVQIDESAFSHKVKHHKGRGPQKTLWVFGIVDTSTTPGKHASVNIVFQGLLFVTFVLCRKSKK